MPWPRRKLVTILDSGVLPGGIFVPPGEGPGGVVDGLGVWYKADSITGTDGAPVAVWEDSGANGLDLTATLQPTLQTNELNGQPVVRFDGVDDYMVTAPVLGSKLAGPTAQTVFVVQKQLATDGGSLTYQWDSSGTANNVLGAHWAWTDNDLYYDTGSALGAGRLVADAPLPWRDTWHLIEAVRDGVTGSYTIEGNVIGTYSAQPSASFNAVATSSLWVGSSIGGLAANAFQGDMAELIMYNRTLTTTERDTVRNYLKAKWGIAQNKVVLDTTRTGYVRVNTTTNDRVAVTI